MKDNIFSELFNKVFGFFRQAEKEKTAKDTAVNRLRVVLMQDRTNLSPELMERMRKELVELLSKYVEMDKDALELNLEQEGEQMALMLSIPVLRAKDEAEIEKALEEEASKEEDIESEDENAQEDEASEESLSEEEVEENDLNAEEDQAAEETDEELSESKNNKQK